MSLLQYSVKNMIGGVSQQPDNIRLQNQCDEMTNCIPSVTDFLKRRPGTQHIAKLLDSLPDNAFVDFIVRGERDAGLLVITGGHATVYKLDGTMVDNCISSYLNCQNPKEAIKLTTINDYNFILNTAMQVGGSAGYNGDYGSQGGFIFIKQAAYNTTYRIIANGKAYTYTTPLATAVPAGYVLSTEIIAKELARKITEGIFTETIEIRRCIKYGHTMRYPGNTAPSVFTCGFLFNIEDRPCGYPTTIFGYEYGTDTLLASKDEALISKVFYEKSIIRITADVKVEALDGMSGQFMAWFKGVTNNLTELPVIAPNGYIIEIIGDPSNKADNYYVKFVANDKKAKGEIGEGYWKETCKKGEEYKLINSSMPHNLRVSSGSITMEVITWGGRTIGDEDSSPAPSFLNKTINDIFFYRNRLCLLTDDNLCMSEAGEYFNFFNTTATALLDSDPIDVAVSATKVSKLKYGVPYNEGLFIYSDGTLFVTEHGEVLSTANISIRPLLQFDSFLSAKPLVSDTNIFYSTARGNNTQLREYIPNNTGDMYGYSNDITSHIPTYIPKDIINLSVWIEESALFLTAANGKLYVYKWQNGGGNERVQSAWGRWEFSGNVIQAEVINGILYLIVKYTDGVYLEKLNLSGAGDFKDRLGLAGKETDFKSLYSYSTQYLRWEPATPAVTAGRTQLRTLTVRYTDSGAFKIIIERRGRQPEERIISAVGSGEARVALLANNEDTKIRIESMGANQFKLTESRFEAVFTSRSKII